MNADSKATGARCGSERALALRWKDVMTTRREQKPESTRTPPAIGNSSPEVFLTFVGSIPAEDLALMQNAIDQSCERAERKSPSSIESS
jgi:hypothetical protein